MSWKYVVKIMLVEGLKREAVWHVVSILFYSIVVCTASPAFVALTVPAISESNVERYRHVQWYTDKELLHACFNRSPTLSISAGDILNRPPLELYRCRLVSRRSSSDDSHPSNTN